ncbi:O-antigen polymerase [Metabacillus fastidiosus]|uniref:O-antigen ligase family protein n=1 Tax=Metabacillus fastidiosus TaxID=1458 RepID=UPI002E1C79FC|nr:O-antigen ligase [Metabacillus fastidiosus]
MKTSIESRNVQSPIVVLLVVLMGAFLNQSNIIFGVNFSFSDFFAIALLLYLIFKNKIDIPIFPTIFFIILSIVVLFTSFFYVPITLHVYAQPVQIISDYIKLIAIFFFFVLGFNLSKLGMLDILVKYFALFGVLIGSIGVFFYIFNISLFANLLFYADIRYRGLMNDPNYFSILQILALVYFSRVKNINFIFKYVSILILISAVLISGSKTGIIVVSCYSILRLIEYIFITRKNLRTVFLTVILLLIFIGMWSFVINVIQDLLNLLVNDIPALSRVQTLFIDFNGAISEGGSGRETAWNTALELVKLSPFIGIGLANYILLGIQFFGVGTLAHNTYLQLIVEWGIPLASIFFIYVFFVIVKAVFSKKEDTIIKILRDILIVLLLGSVAISLNNARIFWLVLGGLIFYLNKRK